MIGTSNLKVLFDNLLATKIVKSVYHSVIIRADGNGDRKPYAPVQDRYQYVGIDDTKGFLTYCRAVSPLESLTEERVGSCGAVQHRTQVTHRLVFFNPHEKRAHDDITGLLITAVLNSGPGIRFLRVYTNAEDILSTEAPSGRFGLKPSSYYTAIEFSLLLKVQTDNCSKEITCNNMVNPYC